MINEKKTWAVAGALAALLSVSSTARSESPTPPSTSEPEKAEAGQPTAKLVTVVFEDAELLQVAASLEMQTGQRILLDPGVREMRVSVLKKSAPLAEVLDSIALANGLKVVPWMDGAGFVLAKSTSRPFEYQTRSFAPPEGMSIEDLTALLQPLVSQDGKIVLTEQPAEVVVTAPSATMEVVRLAAEALGAAESAPLRVPTTVLEQVREPLLRRYPGAEILVNPANGQLVLAGTEPDRTRAQAYLRVLTQAVTPAESTSGEAEEPRQPMDRAARLRAHEERVRGIIMQRRLEAAEEEGEEAP